MKRLKLISLAICVAMLVVSLAACSSSKPGESKEGEVTVWKMAHIRPAGSVSDLDFQAFVKDVEERSNGSLKIELYPASQLGDYTVVQERVSIGDVEMQCASVGTNLDKSFGITSAPYLVENWEQARKVYASDSTLNTAMAEILDKNNMTLIAVYPLYFGGIALVDEPKEPQNADVPKNIKIRVPPIKSFEKTAEALGLATPLPFSETFTAMQTGMVNGAIGAGAEGYYSNFKDLIKWYLPLNDHFEMWYMYVNKDAFERLSPEQQEALTGAAKAMEEKRFIDAEAQEKEFEDLLAEAGATIVEFSEEDLAAFAQKVREEVWPLVKGDYGEELFERVISEIE
jgi:TRAP-type C4-dicarboxylate transport system substrate-binding protein